MSTIHFQAFIIWTPTYGEETWPLTNAQLRPRAHFLWWKGIHWANLYLSKVFRFEPFGSKAFRIHFHSNVDITRKMQILKRNIMLTSKGNMLCKNPTGQLCYVRLPTITLWKKSAWPYSTQKNVRFWLRDVDLILGLDIYHG